MKNLKGNKIILNNRDIVSIVGQNVFLFLRGNNYLEKVSTLDHKVLDHPVKGTAFEPLRYTILPVKTNMPKKGKDVVF